MTSLKETLWVGAVETKGREEPVMMKGFPDQVRECSCCKGNNSGGDRVR